MTFFLPRSSPVEPQSVGVVDADRGPAGAGLHGAIGAVTARARHGGMVEVGPDHATALIKYSLAQVRPRHRAEPAPTAHWVGQGLAPQRSTVTSAD